MEILILVIGLLFAYVLGSLSSAVWVCRIMRLPDPRLEGSKNPGATNVLRLGGRFPAALTLFCDLFKGLVPVLVLKWLSPNPWLVGSVLLAAVLGHLYPLFFEFKGGKGVATALGGIIGISPLLGGIFIAMWLSIFALTRISSLSALIAIASMPLWGWQLLDKRYALILLLLAVIVIWRHQGNIQRLLTKNEDKSSFKH